MGCDRLNAFFAARPVRAALLPGSALQRVRLAAANGKIHGIRSENIRQCPLHEQRACHGAGWNNGLNLCSDRIRCRSGFFFIRKHHAAGLADKMLPENRHGLGNRPSGRIDPADARTRRLIHHDKIFWRGLDPAPLDRNFIRALPDEGPVQKFLRNLDDRGIILPDPFPARFWKARIPDRFLAISL